MRELLKLIKEYRGGYTILFYYYERSKEFIFELKAHLKIPDDTIITESIVTYLQSKGMNVAVGDNVISFAISITNPVSLTPYIPLLSKPKTVEHKYTYSRIPKIELTYMYNEGIKGTIMHSTTEDNDVIISKFEKLTGLEWEVLHE